MRGDSRMTLIALDIENDIRRLQDTFKGAPAKLRTAARIAVNEGARFARTQALKEMQSQVNLPMAYLRKNLQVTSRATNTSLEAVVTGRRRPTSLARFVVGQAKFGKRNVKVRVKRGGAARRIPGAFITPLRAGSDLTDEKRNIGLAVRVPSGGRLKGGRGKLLRKDTRGDTWLMYGPSVDQVFRTVRDDVTPAVFARMEKEFNRQVGRLLG